jgi:hypothetical protein
VRAGLLGKTAAEIEQLVSDGVVGRPSAPVSTR